MIEVKKGINRFYVGDTEDKAQAEMTFVISDENIIKIEHTLIKEELNGQGIGKLLLKELVDWARGENKKIIPLCPYAKAQMEKNKEYHDMIY